ncbi:hybrid sensor histidine kinase/response regulator [Rhodobacteraceae bacterium RKSG542]|uniref:PAS domain-containing hybrid sensor histidine kinase/response regulator n=1 Tax=Pseudovibrio flavus TaxID=2529854 RepID=UPI0012BD515A|nr:PAS domain-containing hybrid sensor histidine kinase/response regulator [Pseudovibrio flavus]MTI18826.1 hybrid sensor histidine kinase/response regulator [Pseudovibrio flavus]
MLEGWVVVLVALAYIILLFFVASYGDNAAKQRPAGTSGRPYIYALSLSVYCTSWTFFGSVGSATRSGFEFFAIYLGPILLFLFGYPIIRRVIRLAKTESITSVADFIAARYGKNQAVAAVVTLIAVVGMIPYIALQLKAVSLSVDTIVAEPSLIPAYNDFGAFGDETLLIAVFMAVFTWLFGTRHIDATEHQEGLMLAIATEAVVKLVAFLAAGIWVTYWLFDGPVDLFLEALAVHEAGSILTNMGSTSNWIAISTLSLIAILLLPRQFHVTVTENNSEEELKKAKWLFPAYLIGINIFVVPIAVAGVLLVGYDYTPDMFVLALPRVEGAEILTLLVFIGGLSAATAMVIVTTVALSIMVSNDLVMPLILRRRSEDEIISSSGEDVSQLILNIRRTSIFLVVLGGYAYYRAAGDSAALSAIGLLSFAAIAQFAPAFFLGLFWRRGTARGALASMLSGFAIWGYTLFIPAFAKEGFFSATLLSDGPFGIEALRPEALFYTNLDPFIHGVIWSLGINVLCYFVFSLSKAPTSIERLQANTFAPADFTAVPSPFSWRTTVTIGDLQATIARYVGEERTQRSFDTFARTYDEQLYPEKEANAATLRFSEQLLASAIGSASARLVLSLLVKRRDPDTQEAIQLLDDATEAIQYNRDLLQIALDQVRQGIAVYNPDMQLICWNRQFRELLDLPPEYGQVGVPMRDILMDCAERGEFGTGSPKTLVQKRFNNFIGAQVTYQQRMHVSGSVLEVRTSPMPDGGIVTTYNDITERVMAEEALSRANETLEKRVRDRTEQLTLVNQELDRARHHAELAYQDKTRFLAAAGHDILQPLNAARLYSSTLLERLATDAPADPSLVHNIAASLESVEEIIGAVLDISRLDTGSFKPEFSVFRLDAILNPLRREFEAIAAEKGLKFKILPTDAAVRSDRRLLRRLLQNLISNAVKYTQSGGVLVGCRKRANGSLSLEIYDTGIGIPENRQKQIFKEFSRLDDGARVAQGLGLGLSIVERISKVLHLPISLQSAESKGSCFRVALQSIGELPQEQPEKKENPVVGQLDKLFVLAVDNETQILQGMEALLSTWGCEVIAATDEITAAKAIHAAGRMPDIVLIDYHLDQGTGLEAIARLRWKFGINIPALLITADRSIEVRDAAAELGMKVLNKPIKPAALRGHLTRAKSSV